MCYTAAPEVQTQVQTVLKQTLSPAHQKEELFYSHTHVAFFVPSTQKQQHLFIFTFFACDFSASSEHTSEHCDLIDCQLCGNTAHQHCRCHCAPALHWRSATAEAEK